MDNKYLRKLKWAVFTIIDRATQDDRKSKVKVSGAFSYPSNAEEFIKTLPTDHNGMFLILTIWSGSKSFIILSRILTRNTVITQYFMLKMEISQLTKKTNSAICFIFGQIQKLEGLTCFEN